MLVILTSTDDVTFRDGLKLMVVILTLTDNVANLTEVRTEALSNSDDMLWSIDLVILMLPIASVELVEGDMIKFWEDPISLLDAGIVLTALLTNKVELEIDWTTFVLIETEVTKLLRDAVIDVDVTSDTIALVLICTTEEDAIGCKDVENDDSLLWLVNKTDADFSGMTVEEG